MQYLKEYYDATKDKQEKTASLSKGLSAAEQIKYIDSISKASISSGAEYDWKS
jgi:hypothetical protein